jgi:hypothetical protein
MSKPDEVNIIIDNEITSLPGAVPDTPESKKPSEEKSSDLQPSPKKDDDSLSTLSDHYVAEKDNLPSQDTATIIPTPLNRIELVRLIRSLPGLTPLQIRIIEIRYVNLIHEYEVRSKYIDIFFHFSRAFVSLGSVAVPALLSIQSPTSTNSVGVYWMTWTISLLVTVFHNFTTLFRFDKKFFGVHNTLERLKSEGWQYLELSGRYSGHYGHHSPTHENQFPYFVHSIEKIRLRQVEDEYNAIRETEKQANPPPPVPTKPTAISEQILPSPLDLTLNRGLKKEIPMPK